MKSYYLITAVGGDIGSSVARCLSNEVSKEKLIGCDITPYVSSYDDVNEFFLVPPYTEESRYIQFVLDECKKRKITHILPMTEGEIKLFDKHRELFCTTGIKLMINSSEILRIAFSKYDTAIMLKKLKLDTPKTWRAEQDMQEVQYPVIIKPDKSCGSRSVKVVHNNKEYREAILNVPDAVIQEYIGTPEQEYTVGVFSDGKDIEVIAFRRTLANGMSKLVEQVKDDRINNIAKIIAKAFQLRGSINIQMRLQDERYYIFEINPRISSTVGFRYLLGFKDIVWWLDLLNNKNRKITYIPEPLPVIGIRTYGEKILRNDYLKSKRKK